jgi:hypothetical protein
VSSNKDQDHHHVGYRGSGEECSKRYRLLGKPRIEQAHVASQGEEKFQRSYTYVGAVQRYRDKITDKTKEEALKLAKKFFQGQVEKIFIVLKE